MPMYLVLSINQFFSGAQTVKLPNPIHCVELGYFLFLLPCGTSNYLGAYINVCEKELSFFGGILNITILGSNMNVLPFRAVHSTLAEIK